MLSIDVVRCRLASTNEFILRTCFDLRQKMLVTCSGIIVSDVIAAGLPKISKPGELTFAPLGIKLCIGGHAANVSIDLTKLSLPGKEISLVGAVGEDLFGDFIEDELKKHGIVTHLERVRKAATSVDLILVVEGEDRRYHADVGANYYLDIDHVLAALEEEKPLIFYVGAAGLLGEFDERLVEVLQAAKRLGCITFVDPVVPYRHGWEPLLSALKWVDIFHCNNVEALELAGKKELGEALETLSKDTKLTVVTSGEYGLLAKVKDRKIIMPAFKVPTVDPSGAGDAFCAGIIYRLIRILYRKRQEIHEISNEALLQILLEGAASGAVCVTGIGTTTAVTREKVDELLEEQGRTILEQVLVSSK
ncbi:MAG: carbohydrate kinase family protein [Nitrososphaeria archaeon]